MDLSQNDWTKQLRNDANAIILDVRTSEEISHGYIPGAQHIDIHKAQEFLDEIKKLNTSKNYYVYCRVGGRSAQACAVMNQLGFKNTYNLIGGFTQWEGEVTYPD